MNNKEKAEKYDILDCIEMKEVCPNCEKENAQLKEQIERLEKQYDRAKWWLNEIVKNHRFTPISTAEKALKDLSELEK